jgi:hypothetical protein
VDLTCIRPGRDHGCSEVIYIQCKTNGRLDPAEWDAFFDFCDQYGGDPVLAHSPKRGVVEYLLLLGYKERGRRLHDQPVKEIDPT